MSDVNINVTRLPVEELHFSFLVHKLRNEFGYLQSSREKIPVDGDGSVMPLFTYPAYEYLNSIDWTDPKPAKVFEYGSGYSSLWWAAQKRCIVRGVDADEQWAKDLSESENNVQITYEPDLDKFAQTIEKFDTQFDVIVIDSKVRYDCVDYAINCLKDDGMIILDNTDWHVNTKGKLDECEDLIPIHFHGFKPIHVQAETTSCYIARKFSRVPFNMIPMGGTMRETIDVDRPRDKIMGLEL